MFEHIDWDTTIISTITSGAIAVGIAWYFRFRAKPKIEVVFEDNRKSSFHYLFSNLASFDSYFGSFYEIFEKDVTELRGSDKAIVRSSPIMRSFLNSSGETETIINLGNVDMDLIRRFEFTKKNLEPMLENMRRFYKTFSDDYTEYHKHMHDTFLRDVIRYYNSTIEYARWVLQGEDYSVHMASRLQSAFKIIHYLEKDKSIDKSFEPTKEFLKKWEPYRT